MSRRLDRVILLLLLAVATGAACGQAADTTSTTAAVESATIAATTTTLPATTTVVGTDWVAVAQRHADELAADMAAGGAIVGIWRDGTLHVAAAGEQPDGSPIPPSGAWRIGSITKTFMAATVLRLVDQGVVDLDAPAATYVTDPEIPASVSVGDLLGHTSGIFNYTDDISFFPASFADLEQTRDPKALVAQALELRDVEPDPAWAYSNTNYLVLGLLVEEVTGAPVGDALDAVATEARLASTYLEGAEAGPAPVAGFTFFPGQKTAVDTEFPYASTASGAWTAGAMVSDAADLMTFFRTLLHGELLSDASLDQMLDVGIEGYGLGISKVSGLRTEVFGHNGGTVGYISHASFARDADTGVVIGLNADRPPPAFDVSIQKLLSEALSG